MTRESPTWFYIDDKGLGREVMEKLEALPDDAKLLYVAGLWYCQTRGTSLIPKDEVDGLIDRFFEEDAKHEWHRHRAPDAYEPPSGCQPSTA